MPSERSDTRIRLACRCARQFHLNPGSTRLVGVKRVEHMLCMQTVRHGGCSRAWVWVRRGAMDATCHLSFGDYSGRSMRASFCSILSFTAGVFGENLPVGPDAK